MARPPLPLGTWGKITRLEVSPGRWRARALYRDFDGRTRAVERYATSGAKAERALTKALGDRGRVHGDAAITPETTMTVLSALWIAKKRKEKKATETTIGLYEQAIRLHIVPGVGKVRVREATVGVMEGFIDTVAHTPAVAHRCRVVLRGMLTLAAQHDAIDRNPVRETTPVRPDRKEIRAFTPGELAGIRARIADYAGGNQFGKPRAEDLPELFELWLGTAGRINEVLPAEWPDVDWGGPKRPPSIVLHRTKGRKNDLTVILPSFAVAALRRQQARELPGPLIFPSRAGTARTDSNVRRQLRDARRHVVVGADGKPDGDEMMFEWVTPHTCRKTAATAVAAEYGVDVAAEQLGHASSAVTEAHYIERASEVRDTTAALDRLSPVRAISGG